jgi:hypothetical protein
MVSDPDPDPSTTKKVALRYAHIRPGSRCCDICRYHLDDRHEYLDVRQKFYKPLEVFTASAKECDMCWLFYDGLCFQFGFKIDISSDVSLKGILVYFESKGLYLTPAEGSLLWSSTVTMRLLEESRHSSYVQQHPEVLNLTVEFDVVWDGSACTWYVPLQLSTIVNDVQSKSLIMPTGKLRCRSTSKKGWRPFIVG